jgi:hypothetical protein
MEHDVHAQQRIVVRERSPQETTDASELVVRNHAGNSHLEGQGMKEHEMISAITLRDFFATYAMQGIVANLDEEFSPEEFEGMAKIFYLMADAMLKAREE